MFWENGYNYKIICDTITDENLKEFLKENDIFLEIVDNSTRWCAFAHYYGHKHGLSSVHATSFSYMVSLFMTGMGISASTEILIKEETLELNLVDYYNQLQSEDSSETEKVIKMFNHIFEVYSEDISEYEYATERLTFRVTPSEMKKFQNTSGKNNKEKLKCLLDRTYNKTHYEYNVLLWSKCSSGKPELLPIEIRIPKCVKEIQFNESEIRDSFYYLCEKNNIKIVNDIH